MQVKEAISRAEKEEKIRKLHGYYLGSCFACLKAREPIIEWTLLYYNPEKKMAVDCFVNDKFVTVSEETRPLKDIEKMDMDEVHIGVEKAMELTNYRKKIISILITLHRREKMLWTINMIGADFSATTYDVDTKTGKILREETTSLIRKLEKKKE